MSDSAPKISIGIIMDGNRRWATAHGLPTLVGHEKGSAKIREVVLWAIEEQISYLYLYAFSTENWNRAEVEVGYLMILFERAFKERMKDIEELGVRIRIVGERERFSEKLQTLMSDIEERSKENTALTIVFCLSYGGRREIADAISRLPEGITVTEESISNALWTAQMPDPDLIIRSGGEKRLSNFLPWQSVYSELFFSDTLWPDFTKEEFSRILHEYRERERRYGS